MNWTEEEYAEYMKNNKKKRPATEIAPEPEKKKSKHGNKMVTIDGYKFPSKLEADYYCDLVLRLRAGDIKGFARQARFGVGGGREYLCDFIVWYLDGTSEIIDTKGFETEIFKIKADLFNEKYPGLEIKIIK